MIESNWTDAEVEAIKSGMDYPDFRDLFPHRNRNSWYKKKVRVLGPVPAIPATQLAINEARDEAGLSLYSQEANLEELFAYLESGENMALAGQFHTTYADATFTDDLPVGILFTGDWHVGASGTQLGKIVHLCRVVAETPGLFAVGMGDYVEGASVHGKNSSALYSDSMDGEQQDRYVISRIGLGRDKWIALCAGNHDMHAYKHAGVNRMARIAGDLGLPLFSEGGGVLRLTVGGTQYKIAVRHDHGGSTAANPSGAGRKLNAQWPYWELLDGTVLAHRHFNDLHLESTRGSRIVHARSGTFKLYDPFADSLGRVPEEGSPLFILYPGPNKLICPWRGDDLAKGLDYLALERQRYQEKAA